MASPLIRSLESPLRALHAYCMSRCGSHSLVSSFTTSSNRSFSSLSTSSFGKDISNLSSKLEECPASCQVAPAYNKYSGSCRISDQGHAGSSLRSFGQGSSRAPAFHSLSTRPNAFMSTPRHQVVRPQAVQLKSRQLDAFSRAGLSTSALNFTQDESSLPASPTFPPGSEQWKKWTDVLSTVPHIGSEGAREILIAAPQLLAGPTEGVALRLSHLAQLLTEDAGVKDTDFAELLKASPTTIINTTFEQAADVLDWFKRTGHFGMRELNRAARHTPEVLSYSVEELRARLQSLLTLGLESAERACLCIIHTPRLLTFEPATLASKLDILVKEFGCSKRYILQSSAHVLDRNTERLLARAALLRHLGSRRVMIGDVYGAVSDAAFADVAVSAHLKRTEKTLQQLCSELLKLPGMSEVIAHAGLDLDVGTPLQCFQAYHAFWKQNKK